MNFRDSIHYLIVSRYIFVFYNLWRVRLSFERCYNTFWLILSSSFCYASSLSNSHALGNLLLDKRNELRHCHRFHFPTDCNSLGKLVSCEFELRKLVFLILNFYWLGIPCRIPSFNARMLVHCEVTTHVKLTNVSK